MSAFAAVSPTPQLQVVVAEDSPPMQALVSAYLEQQGAVVHRAADGDHALELVREHAPQAVVLDLNMPGMTGLEVLDALRHAPGSPAVVVFTATEDADQERLAQELGVDAVVHKPGVQFLHRALVAAVAARASV